MDRKIIINELKQMKLIAHRLGYQMTKHPENSLEVLNTIFENKELLDNCYGFEFDICFTKDHIPVVIHDKYIDDICDNTGLIKEYTYEELRKINFKFRKSLIDDYICKNKEDMLEYEISSAKSIILKKQKDSEEQEIRNYLYRKGYMTESVNIAFDDINEQSR